MTVLKRYVLRIFISLKHITANVVDRNNGVVVGSASTVEHCIGRSLELNRTRNAKAAAVIGQVLAMRLKVKGLEEGRGRGIHADVNMAIRRKGLNYRREIWAIVNSLKDGGVKLIFDDNDDDPSMPKYP